MKLLPPRYLTSGSPRICGYRVVPIDWLPGDGRSPVTHVCPPSSEATKPETMAGLGLKPAKSLKPMTTCLPLSSAAIEVSDWNPFRVKTGDGTVRSSKTSRNSRRLAFCRLAFRTDRLFRQWLIKERSE